MLWEIFIFLLNFLKKSADGGEGILALNITLFVVMAFYKFHTIGNFRWISKL